MKYSLIILAAAVLTMAACKSNKTEDGYEILPNGIELKITEDKAGEVADSGSSMMYNLQVSVHDSLVFDSKKANNGNPIPQVIFPTQAVGDLMAVYTKLSQGDKATARVAADSIFKGGQQMPPFIKSGDVINYEIEVVELKTASQLEKETKEALANESKNIEKYIADNKLDAKKTASGMYIVTTQEGSGESPKNGQKVTMNYTGYLLDGTIFDSNELEKFGHVQPFEFSLGVGQVIKGWDEGVATLKKGGKAKLIIPSGLGYGERAQPGRDVNPKGIPANSTLVFDVTVKSFKDAPQNQGAQPQIQLKK